MQFRFKTHTNKNDKLSYRPLTHSLSIYISVLRQYSHLCFQLNRERLLCVPDGNKNTERSTLNVYSQTAYYILCVTRCYLQNKKPVKVGKWEMFSNKTTLNGPLAWSNTCALLILSKTLISRVFDCSCLSVKTQTTLKWWQKRCYQAMICTQKKKFVLWDHARSKGSKVKNALIPQACKRLQSKYELWLGIIL